MVQIIKDNEFQIKMETLVTPLLKKNRENNMFVSVDGTEINYEVYRNSKNKGSVVIAHGYCEFISKLEEVIYYFFIEGYSVYCIDHRGHGYSERKVDDLSRVHVDSFDEYVEDLYTFVHHEIKIKDKQDNVALFAHSMGGGIGALCIEKYPELFKCAILSSPLMQTNYYNHSPRLSRILIRFLKARGKAKEYFPGQHSFTGKNAYEKSGCVSKARYEYIFSKRISDENYQTYGASVGWVNAEIKAMKKLQANAHKVELPIILFQAENDFIVLPGGQKEFAEKSKNTELVLIEKSKHEIYNATEDVIEEYFRKIFSFLEKHT